MKKFSPKFVSEALSGSLNFSPLLAPAEIVTSAAVNVTVISGVDATPSAMKSGSTAFNDEVVSQLLINGIANVKYQIEFVAHTNQQHTFIERRELSVIA